MALILFVNFHNLVLGPEKGMFVLGFSSFNMPPKDGAS